MVDSNISKNESESVHDLLKPNKIDRIIYRQGNNVRLMQSDKDQGVI